MSLRGRRQVRKPKVFSKTCLVLFQFEMRLIYILCIPRRGIPPCAPYITYTVYRNRHIGLSLQSHFKLKYIPVTSGSAENKCITQYIGYIRIENTICCVPGCKVPKIFLFFTTLTTYRHPLRVTRYPSPVTRHSSPKEHLRRGEQPRADAPHALPGFSSAKTTFASA